ncbi:MAG: hypothetical protein WKF43_02770 [Acidimicrobiales bacterium]
MADLILVCAALFVLLTTAAMVVFPGGAPYDLVARHYLFFDNTFSDLGGLRTYTGRENDRSRVLFTIALILVGTSIVGFGPAWRAWASPGRATRFGTATSAFALSSGVGFVATAFLPWDKYLDTHDTVVQVTFGLLAGFIVCLAVVQIANKAPRPWIAANVAYLVGVIGYAAVEFLGPDLTTRRGLRLHVGTQKAIVYASILNLAVQAWGVRSRSAPTGGRSLPRPGDRSRRSRDSHLEEI